MELMRKFPSRRRSTVTKYFHGSYVKSLFVGLVGFSISKAISFYLVLRLHQGEQVMEFMSQDMWNRILATVKSISVGQGGSETAFLLLGLAFCSVESVLNLVLMIASRRKSQIGLAAFIAYRVVGLCGLALIIVLQHLNGDLEGGNALISLTTGFLFHFITADKVVDDWIQNGQGGVAGSSNPDNEEVVSIDQHPRQIGVAPHFHGDDTGNIEDSPSRITRLTNLGGRSQSDIALDNLAFDEATVASAASDFTLSNQCAFTSFGAPIDDLDEPTRSDAMITMHD